MQANSRGVWIFPLAKHFLFRHDMAAQWHEKYVEHMPLGGHVSGMRSMLSTWKAFTMVKNTQDECLNN